MLLAIDSGTDTGWALFGNDKRLVGCGLGDPGPAYPGTHFGEDVIIECPRLRPRGEKNPNAILSVARNAGEWGGRYAALGAQVRYVTPNDWKGSTSKGIDHARTWAKLTEGEKTIVDKAFRAAHLRTGTKTGKGLNIMDAIGIGLWAVKR